MAEFARAKVATMDEAELDEVQQQLGVTFDDINLLRHALTPRDLQDVLCANDEFERLEYLGDAVMGLAVKTWIFQNNYSGPRQLSPFHQALVQNRTLGVLGQDMGLLERQIMPPGFVITPSWAKSPSGLKRAADMLEAIVGAVYVDRGYEAAQSYTLTALLPRLRKLVKDGVIFNPKGRLQGLTVKTLGYDPEYRLVSDLPEIDGSRPMVTIAVFAGDQKLGRATASTKAAAERAAALDALKQHFGVQER
jgi:ribonuclease-3